MENGFNPMEYFNYYMNHTYNVLLAWKDIRDVLYDSEVINDKEYDKINRLIIWHDNSKIEKEEFNAYGMKFFGKEKTEEANDQFKEAWNHHKSKNLHHHQSLAEYNGLDKKCYIIEMLCDWIAMGWEMGSLAQEYYIDIKEKIELSNEDKILIEKIFYLIKENKCYSDHKITNEEKRLIYYL